MHDTLRDCTMNSVDENQWSEFNDDIVMLSAVQQQREVAS